MTKTKSVNQMTRHESKEYYGVREELEGGVIAKDDEGKIIPPKPAGYLTKDQKKVFKQLMKLNRNFCIDDSNSLSRLTIAIYEIAKNNILVAEMSPTDPDYKAITKNLRDYDAMANHHEKMLYIPMAERYKAAADAARLIIEERKAEAMSGQKQDDPLLELVADIMGDDNE